MMHRALTMRALLALLSALSVGSQLSAQDRKALPVVFTGLAWNSELPFRVALARGFFKAHGLEIQPIFVRGGPMALAALSSGDVNFAEIGGAQAVMRSRARGLEVSIIASIANATTFQLIGGRAARSLEDLKGKIIGVTGAGAFSDFAMRTFLRVKGIDTDKDVTLRAVGAGSGRISALEKGIIAAAPFSPEDTVRLLRLGFPMIANMGDSLNIPQSIVVTRNDVLVKTPDTAKRFLKALLLGIQHAKSTKPTRSKRDTKADFKASRISSARHTTFLRRPFPQIFHLTLLVFSSCSMKTSAPD